MHACARKTYMHVLITNTTHTKKHTRNGYMRNKWRGPKTTHRYMHYKVENKTWYASRDMTCHPIRFYQPHRLFLEAARISRCFLCLVTHPCTCSVSSDTILRSHTILACGHTHTHTTYTHYILLNYTHTTYTHHILFIYTHTTYTPHTI